jgi:hypothetical protein
MVARNNYHNHELTKYFSFYGPFSHYDRLLL